MVKDLVTHLQSSALLLLLKKTRKKGQLFHPRAAGTSKKVQSGSCRREITVAPCGLTHHSSKFQKKSRKDRFFVVKLRPLHHIEDKNSPVGCRSSRDAVLRNPLRNSPGSILVDLQGQPGTLAELFCFLLVPYSWGGLHQVVELAW